MTKVFSAYRDFKAMHYMIRSMLPTSYFIYSVVGVANFILLMYGMTASEVPGSFLNCMIGWICYAAISQAYATFLVKKNWQSKKLHNIALVGHSIVLLVVVNYLFF